MTQVELNAAIQDLLDLAKLADGGKQSALGMARGWIERPEKFGRSIHPTGFEGRDNLAEALVNALQASEKASQQIAALARARARLDAPYRQSANDGKPILKPKEAKKARAKTAEE